MIDFIVEHWGSILVVVAFIAIVVTAIVVLALRGKKQTIYKILYQLVNEAEEQFGSGEGKRKFAFVLERIYSVLPLIIKVFITYNTLERWIEKALEEAKEHWAEKAGITEETESDE